MYPIVIILSHITLRIRIIELSLQPRDSRKPSYQSCKKPSEGVSSRPRRMYDKTLHTWFTISIQRYLEGSLMDPLCLYNMVNLTVIIPMGTTSCFVPHKLQESGKLFFNQWTVFKHCFRGSVRACRFASFQAIHGDIELISGFGVPGLLQRGHLRQDVGAHLGF